MTDAGVSHLRGMRNLKYVHISKSQITDTSLEILAALPKIEGLALQFNSFTDNGVKELVALKHLRSLWICGKRDRRNNVSDDSLQFLLNLPKFDSLGVQHTNVTLDFETRLLARHPKCSVSR